MVLPLQSRQQPQVGNILSTVRNLTSQLPQVSTVSNVLAFAAGYFSYQASGFHVGPPFPVTQNISMAIASGVALQGTITGSEHGQPDCRREPDYLHFLRGSDEH